MLSIVAFVLAATALTASPPPDDPAHSQDEHSAWWRAFISKLESVKTRPLRPLAWDARRYQYEPLPELTAIATLAGNSLTVEYRSKRATRKYQITLLPEWRSEATPELLFFRLKRPDGVRTCASGRPYRDPSDISYEGSYSLVGKCFAGLTRDGARRLKREQDESFTHIGAAIQNGFADISANGDELDIRIFPGPVETSKQVIRATSRPE